MSLVRYERRWPAAVLTICRSDKRNALSRALIADLTSAFQQAQSDPQVRNVILTSEGNTFCAGMDLDELRESLNADAEIIWQDAIQLGSLFELIYTLEKPTIAAINGHAVAGGAGLMSVCDLAIAVPEAKFGYPEVRRGLVAALVLPHLLRHVGERAARYLLLTGELLDAAEAARIGLINQVVATGTLLDVAMTWSKSLSEGGPHALQKTKQLLHQFSHQVLPIQEIAKESAAPRLGEECRQGLTAFFDKKPVPWTSQPSK